MNVRQFQGQNEFYNYIESISGIEYILYIISFNKGRVNFTCNIRVYLHCTAISGYWKYSEIATPCLHKPPVISKYFSK